MVNFRCGSEPMPWMDDHLAALFPDEVLIQRWYHLVEEVEQVLLPQSIDWGRQSVTVDLGATLLQQPIIGGVDHGLRRQQAMLQVLWRTPPNDMDALNIASRRTRELIITAVPHGLVVGVVGLLPIFRSSLPTRSRRLQKTKTTPSASRFQCQAPPLVERTRSFREFSPGKPVNRPTPPKPQTG